jgi:hypothetical protein
MSKYDSLLVDLAKPRNVTPSERAAGAAASVQTSLFGRLRKARGSAVAGRTAWMLVRAGSPSHVDCGAALDALATLPDSDLRTFVIVACGARDSLKNAEASALAAAVAAAVEGVLALRGESLRR